MFMMKPRPPFVVLDDFMMGRFVRKKKRTWENDLPHCISLIAGSTRKFFSVVKSVVYLSSWSYTQYSVIKRASGNGGSTHLANLVELEECCEFQPNIPIHLSG